MIKLFAFGLGYTATALAARLSGHASGRGAGPGDVTIVGTRTRPDPSSPIETAVFQGDGRSHDVAARLAGTTHVLVSIPPGLEGCPALTHFGADLSELASLVWVGYLSTIGVYGDAQGRMVDEDTPVRPTSERALRRFQAETAWQAFGRKTGKRVEIFRLPGIYGPGRSVIDHLRGGTAKRIVKPGQVFNRIHVDDIALALETAMTRDSTTGAGAFDVFNVTDDEPCPPQDVVVYAAELLGVPPPPEVAFADARLTPMGASFYAENKRVSNARLKQVLGLTLQYPTYREGLLAVLRARP